MFQNVCCVFGHRTINETEELKLQVHTVMKELVINEGVDTFLFGSKSRFNDLCLEVVTELKEEYPNIKRVYVRAEYPYINDNYKEYLLESYEDTYYPERIKGSGKGVYVERNYEMIDKSQFCVVYYVEQDVSNRKIGTKIALGYAIKQRKRIIILPIGK